MSVRKKDFTQRKEIIIISNINRNNYYLFTKKILDLNRNDYDLKRRIKMAKKSKIAKEKKRQEIVERYAEIRKELKAKGDYEALRKLPRDSAPTRLHNRCEITGRPRGYMRKFGMSRITFRELAHKGRFQV